MDNDKEFFVEDVTVNLKKKGKEKNNG